MSINFLGLAKVYNFSVDCIDFDEVNAGVFLEEDGSVDEIATVVCSVREYFEQLLIKAEVDIVVTK